jgi:hypothetical protein
MGESLCFRVRGLGQLRKMFVKSALALVVFSGGCSEDCTRKWAYQQFSYFPQDAADGTVAWDRQLEIRFSQAEKGSFGQRTLKRIKVLLRDADRSVAFFDCIDLEAGYLKAEVEWQSRDALTVRLREVVLQGAVEDYANGSVVRSFAILVDGHSGAAAAVDRGIK